MTDKAGAHLALCHRRVLPEHRERDAKVNVGGSPICNNENSNHFVIGKAHDQHRIRIWTPQMREKL